MRRVNTNLESANIDAVVGGRVRVGRDANKEEESDDGRRLRHHIVEEDRFNDFNRVVMNRVGGGTRLDRMLGFVSR